MNPRLVLREQLTELERCPGPSMNLAGQLSSRHPIEEECGPGAQPRARNQFGNRQSGVARQGHHIFLVLGAILFMRTKDAHDEASIPAIHAPHALAAMRSKLRPFDGAAKSEAGSQRF